MTLPASTCNQHSLNTIPAGWPIASDWTSIVGEYFATKGFDELSSFIQNERATQTVFPAADDVFNAFRMSSYQQTQVVVLGQDPYHGDEQADGLSFSVKRGQKLPPSLRNIFKELKDDIGCDNQTGDLTAWAKQGVLMLNTVLTVRRGQANSHRKKGWEIFTDLVISQLGQRKQPTVFILWGNQAIQKKNLIDSNHAIIQSPHPSPLSAYRGFFGSRPFSRTNSMLSNLGLTPMDWQLQNL